MANSASMPDGMMHLLHGGFWRTDGGFVSTIRIKNVLVVASIRVTPTLFMADGTAYPLPTVTVPVSGVATVNINDALASAPQAVAAHISEYGSLMLLYSYPTPSHLVATLAAIDAPRSLSFVYMINEPMPMPNGVSRAVFENNSSTITKTNIATVGISSTSYSTQTNDVTVQLKFTPSGGAQLTTAASLTMDSPYTLVLGTLPVPVGVSDCTSYPNGTAGWYQIIP